MALLEFSGLGVAYGGVPALDGVSLGLDAGQIVTVIGPNGAGKSTLLNAAMGILPIHAGRILLDGRPLGAMAVEARVEAGLCLVPERRELFSTMTVEENLRLGGFRLRHAGGGDIERVFALFPRLIERRRQRAGTLSGGERQMLAMGRALMARPRLLMLDEPSLGLAPLVVRDIFRTVAELRADGVGVLLVEQNARAALQIADRGHVLEGGRMTLEGDSAALLADRRVVEMYLGAG